MTDPHYTCGSDDRDSLTPRPHEKAKFLKRCALCGEVVYAVGVRRADGSVLCTPCFERVSEAS